MSSICAAMRIWIQPWRNRGGSYVFFRSRRNPNFVSFRISSSSKDDSSSVFRQNQLGYDPSEELFGLGVGLSPRDANSSGSELRSWFGPNGQYIRELPCPSCRGRGYTQCPACGIERSRLDCSQCNGKGMITCHQCLGDCVIWEEQIDEKPWEKARSSSPFKVKEDQEVDDLVLQLDVKKKSKRVYQSPSPEVGLKISRSLKSLNAKTGIFSKRMKLIHRDPVLRAQRSAAIKRAKGTPAARKHASETMTAYFSDPENRRKRSASMLGAKYCCSHCGGQGHRRHYCPELKGRVLKMTCKLCGEEGHNRKGCWKLKANEAKRKSQRRYKCAICGSYGHNQRSCSLPQRLKLIQVKKGTSKEEAAQTLKTSKIGLVRRCKLCGRTDHNKRTCGQGRQRKCSLCGKKGHYRSTCPGLAVLGVKANSDDEGLLGSDMVHKMSMSRNVPDIETE